MKASTPKSSSEHTGESGLETAEAQDADGLETRARKLLEVRAGGAFADEEWGRMRRRLQEYFATLRKWEKQAREGRDNTETS